MTLSIAAITMDCQHAGNLGQFWAAALGLELDPDPNEHFASIGMSNLATGAPTMMFIAVQEGKTAKNRMHLDLQADDRDAEVERLTALGATLVHHKDEWGVAWTTMSDPEGNEFCLATH